MVLVVLDGSCEFTGWAQIQTASCRSGPVRVFLLQLTRSRTSRRNGVLPQFAERVTELGHLKMILFPCHWAKLQTAAGNHQAALLSCRNLSGETYCNEAMEEVVVRLKPCCMANNTATYWKSPPVQRRAPHHIMEAVFRD